MSKYCLSLAVPVPLPIRKTGLMATGTVPPLRGICLILLFKHHTPSSVINRDTNGDWHEKIKEGKIKELSLLWLANQGVPVKMESSAGKEACLVRSSAGAAKPFPRPPVYIIPPLGSPISTEP